MALTPDDEFELDEDDLGPAAAVLGELAAAGAGWVNLSPEVEPDHEPPPRSWLAAIFSARGDAVPLATWAAPEAPGRAATVGIEHGSGPRALARLEAAGLGLAPGWRKVADHPRRGLVVHPAADAAPDDVLWWLLAASHALGVVPLTGRWTARVYRPT